MNIRDIRIAGAAFAVLAAAASAHAAEDRVVVMTSYPDEMVSRYEAAFEKANPGIDMQVVWKMPRDAVVHLRQEKEGGVDVYWSPARNNFVLLRDEGHFRPMKVDRTGVPGAIGKQNLSDLSGLFEAFEVAG